MVDKSKNIKGWGVVAVVVLLAVIVLGILTYLFINSRNSDNFDAALTGKQTAKTKTTQQTSTKQTTQQKTTQTKPAQQTATQPTTQTKPAAPKFQTYSMNISNFAFSKQTLTITIGSTVKWTNKDAAPHTVTSTSGSELASSELSQGAVYSHTFKKAGTFPYFCAYHPSMKGTVIVK